MMSRSLALLAAGALLTAVATSAGSSQTDPVLQAVDASLLQEGIDSLAIYVIRNGDTIRTGTVRDELRVVGSGSDAQLIRVYQARDDVLGPRLDTIANAYPSLTPLSERTRTPRGVEVLEFERGTVTGSFRLTNGDPVAVEHSLPDTVYGGASFDLVLRSAPLGLDWAAAVPSFLATTQTVVRLNARVVGIEEVSGEECWRTEADFAGTPVTFWIGRETRRLHQQVMQLRPDVRILFGSFPPPGPPMRPAV